MWLIELRQQVALG